MEITSAASELKHWRVGESKEAVKHLERLPPPGGKREASQMLHSSSALLDPPGCPRVLATLLWKTLGS